ncbi:MAG: EpsI family protein, partial [Gammaproteobacteria bacterium]|nr:EpsI family protein [Gammaproteobacteria bacterium]
FLQMLTVKAVQLMINKTGLTAHIHGTYIEIPSGTFHVAQSCAGMRYMLIALTLTTLHSYLSFRALLPRFTIIGIGLLLSLLANWIRVYTVVYIGYQTQMQSSIVNDHDTLGWIVFAIVLAPIFFLTSFLNRFDKPSSETSAKSRITIPCAPNSVVSVLLFAIFATTASLASLPQFIASGSSFEPPPKRFARWESIPHKQTAYTSFENPTVQVNSVYRDFSKSISLYIAHYATQNEVSELVSNDNHQIISPWRIIKTQKIIAFKGDALKAVTIKNGESYKQMINWYKIGARRTSSEQHAKAYQLLHLLSLKTSGNFVSVSKPCSDIDHCNSVKELTEFIKELSTHYKEI